MRRRELIAALSAVPALALARRLNATRLQLLDVFGSQMARAPDERTPEETVPGPEF